MPTRLRCTGCLIQSRLSEESLKAPTDWAPARTNKGCSGCHRNICPACHELWSHEYHTIIANSFALCDCYFWLS